MGGGGAAVSGLKEKKGCKKKWSPSIFIDLVANRFGVGGEVSKKFCVPLSFARGTGSIWREEKKEVVLEISSNNFDIANPVTSVCLYMLTGIEATQRTFGNPF